MDNNEYARLEKQQAVDKFTTKSMLAQREKEKSLVPLRVSPSTVILVPKEKATKEYAEWYKLNKLGTIIIR